MSGVFSPVPSAAGFATDNLLIVEQRVQTGLLKELVGGQENTTVAQLRNDEATALSLTTPIPST